MTDAMREALAACDDDPEWLCEQLVKWPARVHPDRTCSDSYLRATAAKLIRAALSAAPQPQPSQSGLPDREVIEALEYLGRDTRLSLYHYSPVYGDDDDQSVEWRVDRESGSVNDREWTTVGRGATPADAILSLLPATSKDDDHG